MLHLCNADGNIPNQLVPLQCFSILLVVPVRSESDGSHLAPESELN
jgi:hypothetical protein